MLYVSLQNASARCDEKGLRSGGCERCQAQYLVKSKRVYGIFGRE